jgi:hypothetical protein
MVFSIRNHNFKPYFTFDNIQIDQMPHIDKHTFCHENVYAARFTYFADVMSVSSLSPTVIMLKMVNI